jgi:hypothetical protein
MQIQSKQINDNVEEKHMQQMNYLLMLIELNNFFVLPLIISITKLSINHM